jgi:hypothetical protein
LKGSRRLVQGIRGKSLWRGSGNRGTGRFGVGQEGVLWAKAAIPWRFVMVVVIPIFLSTYRMERLTGVNTPWRPTLGLFGIAVAGFFLSMV